MTGELPFRGLTIAVLISIACALSACEQSTARFAAQRRTYATDQTPPTDQTGKLIKQLDAARGLDQSYVFDPDLSPERRQDFATQEGKADHVMRELQHGFSVSTDEINEALEIPPRHVTPEMRTKLVAQLHAAQKLDDRRSQEILIYLPDDEPLERSQFDLQSQRAAEVATSLEIGESVNWSKIQQALYVPRDPL